jgi:capsule polysaccharide export protein KpsE/RkpR
MISKLEERLTKMEEQLKQADAATRKLTDEMTAIKAKQQTEDIKGSTTRTRKGILPRTEE